MQVEILSPLMLAPFKFSVDGIPYEILPGFVFDGNSSPRVMWADKVHRAIGKFRGANRLRAQLVYSGIRCGGSNSYRKIHSIEKINHDSCYDFNYAQDRVLELKNHDAAE